MRTWNSLQHRMESMRNWDYSRPFTFASSLLHDRQVKVRTSAFGSKPGKGAISMRCNSSYMSRSNPASRPCIQDSFGILRQQPISDNSHPHQCSRRCQSPGISFHCLGLVCERASLHTTFHLQGRGTLRGCFSCQEMHRDGERKTRWHPLSLVSRCRHSCYNQTSSCRSAEILELREKSEFALQLQKY